MDRESSFLLIHGGRLLASGTADEVNGILADTPQEITLLGVDAARLVPRLAEVTWIETLQLSGDGAQLRLALRDPSKLHEHLATWIATDNLRIDRIQGASGDLTALFELLLRHHRGEAV